MRTRAMQVLMLVVGLVSTGCAGFRSAYDVDPDEVDPSIGVATGNLEVSNAAQTGAMGEVESYGAPTFLADGSSFDGFTTVRLESRGAGWWVMSLIDIRGATLGDLQPGVTYATATSGVLEDGQPEVSVIGCSGPSQGNYTFDTGAERSELTVEDLGAGLRRAHVRSVFVFSGREQVAEATFDYRVAG